MALAALLTVQLAMEGDRRQQAWGPSSEVVVVVRSISAGEPLEADSLGQREVPDGMLPEGAVMVGPSGSPEEFLGRIAATELFPGEILVDTRLAREGFAHGSGTGPDGRIVAIPLDLQAPPLAPGDHVDLLAGAVQTPGEAAVVGVEVVAERGEVVSIGDGTLTVLVDGTEVTHVVEALLAGTVVPTLRPD